MNKPRGLVHASDTLQALAGERVISVPDLFMRLTCRCFPAKAKERIPLLGPYGLANQLGVAEYTRPRRFRQKLEQWLDAIRGGLAGMPRSDFTRRPGAHGGASAGDSSTACGLIRVFPGT